MSSFPWLTTLWVLPIIGAAAALAMPKARPGWAKVVALVASLLTLVVAVVVAVRFEPGGERYQFVESHSWIEAFGARYELGVDGISVVLILLTAVLLPLLLVAGWNDPRIGRSAHLYVALILAVESMVLMSFSALDILLFYVFFEAMLIPMYFLIGGFGGKHRASAAVKFLLYNLLGGLVMLAAVVGLYVGTGTFGFEEIAASAAAGDLGMSPGLLNALFLGFMFAFAVKAPLWPFHSWLPGAAVESTPATAVLMMAVVDKVGTFGMLRYCLQLFPDASKYFAPFVVTLAVIGIVYGAILAIASTDVMRLIAYTSISHFGFIILGIFAMTSQGQTGSTLYMVNHGISTAALFLVAGFLVSRRGTRAIDSYGGIQKVAPVLAGTFLVAGLATLSLPGLAPFVSEFLVLIGTFTRYQVAAVVATSALVLSAVYILWLYQRIMTGPLEKKNAAVHDLVPRELAVMVPLITLLIVLGLYPKPILDIISPAVATTVTSVESDDLTADGQAGIR
ncbi:NADH-quinone oxidoreductase subunit M [Rhodococcus sp. H36-A4]|uniref:NADH-quinone oxidoreductase subunit M n=1 Tax=Rhodococcus sp. H36-A4 TaxID=3004353 RepID=UPI0022B07B84|nr:NADH-quinone oxidoreductase subunit M [Rhodococcus sp. H36-A4]MCZ4078564.1 NADH-quinone oxidoreductase subunit M [Rhodococcus sp. H36-A4]